MKALALRIGAYLGWAVVSLAVVGAFMRAHYPHWGLLVGAGFLLAGMGMLSLGELQPWALRRHVHQPRQFATRVWVLSSFLWVVYVAAVSLPLAFFTAIPSSPDGRRVLGLLTFVPLPLLYLLVWRVLYSRVRPLAQRK